MSANTEELSFEQAAQKLEQIVAELEAGELPLAEALAKFEEGMKLKEICAQKLTQAEARIEEYAELEDEATESEEDSLFE